VALPDRLEAGTVNAPGIAGLLAGIEWLRARGVDQLRAHAATLKQRLYDGLAAEPGVRVVSPPAPDGVPIVTVVADATDPSSLSARLDQEHGVMTRAGLHCAPEAHRILGTDQTGAVRFSLGWASTDSDVQRAVDGVAAVVGAGRGAIVSGV
ncbi:MAG: aminotransferase class V-fold PLP-dependent enzyme, partial [Longimicrobiales bacterium]